MVYFRSMCCRVQANGMRTEMTLEDRPTVRVPPLSEGQRARKSKHEIGLKWICRVVTEFLLSVIEMVPHSSAVPFHTESLQS